MDMDRNLLFGVLALQADLLDAARFAEACTAWTARKDVPLAELLVERGWITPTDRADISSVWSMLSAPISAGVSAAATAHLANEAYRQNRVAVWAKCTSASGAS